ncbi:uncharacterized protein LOC118195181 isoform X2 [Stegodyphus dumicola]|uniref:uncharacterized protein LOC118195181 isoform X2 n=1 Tax=Stegodyphus dumicola TaxID=202533 RepID=UPI0015ABF979|nr:uncharacterized protein LOC118195181 isoform X2 [Stegodyphus dumicola]
MVEASLKKKSFKTFLSYPILKLFISKRAETITVLDMEELNQLSASKFVHFSKIENLKLQFMTFECALNCIDYLPKFCKELPYLTSINLDFINTLKAEHLKLVCLTLSDLEEISIKCYSHLNTSAKYIFQLIKLQYLDISGCQFKPRIPIHSYHMSPFYKAIQKSKLDKLKVLRGSGNILEDIVMEFLQKAPYLVDLDLSSCCIGDPTLKIISKLLIHLKYLNLEDCCFISHGGLIGKIQLICTTYEDKYTSKPLSNTKGLEKLNLSGCFRITDASIIQAIQFQYLQELYLEGCKISDRAMLRMYLNNPCLRKVIHPNYSLL